MPEKKPSHHPGELRQRAEKLLKGKEPELPSISHGEALALLHELHVHQIELEMQNEELQAARSRAEESLGRYSELYDFAPVGYLTLDAEGRIRSINLTGALLLHQERSLLTGARLDPYLSPESRPSFQEWLKEAFQSQDLHACQVMLEGHDPEPRHIELRSDGYSSEAPDECRTIMTDTTQRFKMEAHLHHSEKMMVVGRMAGGIAHDFNNIMAAMTLNLATLKDQTDDPTVASTVGTLADLAERAAGLTRQLLLFSRKQEMKKKPLEINAAIQSTLKTLGRLVSEDNTIHFRPSPEEIWVTADPTMLDQILMNLLLNANDAMPGGGTLTIETSSIEISPDAPKTSGATGSGTFLQLKIQDTGHGMDHEVLDHLFEPFFTTKEEGQGTGLGLASVHSIVEQHRGWIRVDSAPRQGTTFLIFLPVTEGKALPPDRAKAHPEKKGKRLTILLVEDEPAILSAMTQLLESKGFQVFSASNSEEALKQWKTPHRDIELLITDVKMPGKMDGFDLAKELSQRKPSLHIIVMSGYYNKSHADTRKSTFQYKFLPKPFQLTELTEMIGEFEQTS